MKARHKDTGEIIDLAEEGIITHDGRRFCWHQVELIPEPIDECTPSLPSNMDKAAEEYAWKKEGPLADGERLSYTFNPRIDAFKAGAEWMAGQGETHEAEIIESVPFGRTKWQRCVKVWLDNQFQAKGDKVIVQIRKK